MSNHFSQYQSPISISYYSV